MRTGAARKKNTGYVKLYKNLGILSNIQLRVTTESRIIYCNDQLVGRNIYGFPA